MDPLAAPHAGDAEVAHLARRVETIRVVGHRTADGVLAALIDAADEVLSVLLQEQEHVHLCEHQLRRSQDAVGASCQRLELLLRVIDDFYSSSRTHRVVERGPPERPRRRWFRSAKRSPAATTSCPSTEPARTTTPSDDQWGIDQSAPGRAPRPAVETIEPAELESVARDDRSIDLGSHVTRHTCQPPDDADLAVWLLGPFRIARHDEPVDTGTGGKALRVLKYLLSHRDQPVPKEVLMDTFWPDADLETVGRNLHQAIYTLRKLLRCGDGGIGYIVFENGAYAINPKLIVWCDLDEFESAAASGRSAEAEGRIADAIESLACAEECYRGDYLADSPYEEWVIAERERLRLLYVAVANRLADLLFESGDLDTAAAVSQRMLRHEPCDEAAHRRLIHYYGVTGHRNLAIRQYQSYVACAERLYGLGPCPETTELYRSLIAERG